MSFGASHWLYALALLPILGALFFWNQKRARELIDKIVASRLHSTLAGSVSTAKRRLQFSLLLAGLACVIVSLAQPRYGYTWEQSKRKGRDVIIAIDTSKSMLATDIAPNRLTRAKMAAEDLIHLLPGDRVGLVAFAGGAFLQAPLTIDYSAVLGAIEELDTNIIPRGGTDIAEAIRIAADAFGKGESENRCVILFTDGEELDDSGVQAARKNAEAFRIFTVGVGSAEGSIIPVPGEGGTTFVKDPQGQIVKSRLDENRLREISEASSGFYVHLENGPATMKRIVSEGFGGMKERDIDAKQSRRPIERYQWPLGLGLALLAASLFINDRKRTASNFARSPKVRRAAVAATMLLLSCTAFCANSGIELYEKQNYKGAYESFKKQSERNPNSHALHFDAGAAAYKLGEYEQALDAFSKALTSRDPGLRAKAEYNLANTLYERGALQKETEPKIKEWRNALQHYEEAMKVDPKNRDAEHNRDVVRKLIEELEKEPPKQEKQDEEKDQKQDLKQQDDQQDQQSKSGEKKDEQKEQQQGEKKPDGQKQDGSKQEQQRPEGGKEKGEKPDDQQKPEPNKEGEPKDQNESSQNQAQAGTTPAPAPSPSDKKLSGEIKEQGTPSEKSEKEQQAEAALPADSREMTESQARALIESMKGEDGHVQLERKQAAPVLKDW